MITIIACIGSDGSLGVDDRLIFHIKEYMRRFRSFTGGNICLMGRKTFDSIIKMNGKPLSNRINAVLTRDEKYTPRYGETSYTSIDRILNHHETMSEGDKKVFVIGGEQTYRIFLPFV